MKQLRTFKKEPCGKVSFFCRPNKNAIRWVYEKGYGIIQTKDPDVIKWLVKSPDITEMKVTKEKDK